jgi:hypothetical protein
MATVARGYCGGFSGLRCFISYSSMAASHSARSIHFREKVQAVLGNEPGGFLVGVDDGRVNPGLLHSLGRHMLDLLRVRHVEEDRIVRSRFIPRIRAT